MFVYIHVPFCNCICNYCDFSKVIYSDKFSSKYLDNLELEIKNRYKGEEVKSIFIGGGTPTSLSDEEFKRLLDITNIFNKSESIEFSIESNVECLNSYKISLMKSYGVNRVSLGVQSFDDKNLKELNRHHNKDIVFNSVKMLKDSGFSNISIDLIYGVNNNIDIVSRDIDYFLELDIPHVSCYSLIIEDNTLFGINNRNFIDDDIDKDMYELISNKLSSNGYNHYEISNYSKPGYESVHNLNYWYNGYYYGFGLGAVSFISDYRISNTKNLTKYLNGDYLDSSIYEDKSVRMSNDIILGLRTIKGVNLLKFENKYGVKLTDVYDINDLINTHKLIVYDGYLSINKDYIYLSNDILINFI